MMKTYHIQLSLGPLTLGSPFYWVEQIAGLTTFFFFSLSGKDIIDCPADSQ